MDQMIDEAVAREELERDWHWYSEREEDYEER